MTDNVDPDGFKSLLDLLEVRKTLFNVISKSGGTAETMSQFLIIRDLLKKKLGNRKEKDHLVITTDPVQGVLRKIAEEEQFKSFEIPSLLGGRFSVLSAVGLTAGRHVRNRYRGIAGRGQGNGRTLSESFPLGKSGLFVCLFVFPEL